MWEILADLAVLFGAGPGAGLAGPPSGTAAGRGQAGPGPLLRAIGTPRLARHVHRRQPAAHARLAHRRLRVAPPPAPGDPPRRRGPRPEPEAWYDQDWAAKAYQPPGDGPAVHLNVHSRYLGIVLLALRKI